MHNSENLITSTKRVPWNKGKITRAKPPLRPKHVWAIRTKLQIDHLTRDLALSNLAIDNKLRGCDVVAIKVDDVAPNGYAVDRAGVRHNKTGRLVRFELTEPTRQAIDDYIKLESKQPQVNRLDRLTNPKARPLALAASRGNGSHRSIH